MKICEVNFSCIDCKRKEKGIYWTEGSLEKLLVYSFSSPTRLACASQQNKRSAGICLNSNKEQFCLNFIVFRGVKRKSVRFKVNFSNAANSDRILPFGCTLLRYSLDVTLCIRPLFCIEFNQSLCVDARECISCVTV